MTCVWFEMLCRIPIAGLRLHLCRWHVEGCPRCRQAIKSDDAPPPFIVTADRFPAGLDLWPGVKKEIDNLRLQPAGLDVATQPVRRSWRWAYVAAMLVLILLAGFWVLFLGRNMGPHPNPIPIKQHPAVQTQVCSVKIDDRPARVFRIQSRNRNRTIFWIAKENTRS